MILTYDLEVSVVAIDTGALVQYEAKRVTGSSPSAFAARIRRTRKRLEAQFPSAHYAHKLTYHRRGD